MDLSEGMVAVVRGMQDSALCVSLLDGARQYTLLPGPVQTKGSHAQSPLKAGVLQDCRERSQCDTSTQAVDGRYASVYQISHCNVLPTSPPDLFTEFPPQRAELSPGQGNFEVGGLGSREMHCSPTRVSGSFRGGLSWPDRGSVCSPRPMPGPDAFASSLRKYPSLSPDRSLDTIERIVNYSQKNSKNSKYTSRSDCFSQSYERVSRSRFEQEARCPEESPTRDRKEDFRRSYDVKCLREASRRVKDTLRSCSTYPYNNPVCPAISERYDHLPAKPPELNITSSANMETQAAILMVSREVTTTPRVAPSVRNVAVPLTPQPSCIYSKPEKTLTSYSSKSIQTPKALDLNLRIRKSVQTCFSSADLIEKKKIKNKRQSKSQEELRINHEYEDDIVKLIEELTSCPDLDKENAIRSKLIRKFKKNNKIVRNQRVKIKIGRCIKDKMYSEIDLKNFTTELSNELVSKIKQHNMYIASNPISDYRADIHSFTTDQGNYVDEVIKEWLTDIPIKTVDYLGRDIKKGYLLRTVGSKIKYLILNKLECHSGNTMKEDIMNVIEDMPINVSGYSKRFYINQLVIELMKKIKDLASIKWWRQAEEYTHQSQPAEKELKLFVRTEISEFIQKFTLKVCTEKVKQMEIELTGIFIDSLEIISNGNTKDVKENIFVMLVDCFDISEHQAVYFANNVIYNFKDIFTQSCSTNNRRSQTFIVMRNSILKTKEVNKNTESHSKEREGESGTNLDLYTNQIVQEISEWAKNITSFDSIDCGFKKVVINDLAEDIVDRHKYLKLNSSKISTDDDELEHLKYQIFKWMSKVVGEENLDILDHASQLMERIKNIPAPDILKSPNAKTNSCCQNNIPDTSKSRRNSNPSPNSQLQSVDLNMKTRRQSSPGALLIQDNPNPNNFDVAMKSQFNKSVRSTSIPEGKSCCQAGCAGQNDATEPISAKQLNDEYDIYLSNWVQEIPIATSRPEEQALAEKARSGIYNGIWRVIAKLQMNPATITNPVYYQDLFDDELEDLLNCLPQTSELMGKKHSMKAQLIEKTTKTNDLLQRTAGPSTYKQQLIEHITNNLPRRGVDIAGKDPNRIYEEFQKMNLAEDYILYTEYKVCDRAKANTYKKKLMREVQELINGIKARHGKELKDIDPVTYRDYVIAALEKVPLPSDETLQQEAEEIQIGLEVEEWFQDLPLISPDYPEDLLAQRSFKDTLAKKIYEIEKHSNLPTDAERDGLLKEEIRRFLARMPLIPGENKNIDYMIEELINRLRNKPDDFVAFGGERRKSVNFVEGYDYDDFSRDMPVCSSFSDGQTGQANQSSIFIKDGNRVDPENYYGQHFGQVQRTPESQQQWYTLEESNSPRKKVQININPPNPVPFGQLSQPNPTQSEQRDPTPQSEQWLSMEETRAPPGFWNSNAQNTREEGPLSCKSQLGDLPQQHIGASHQQPMSNSSSSQTPALSLHGQTHTNDFEHHDPSSHRFEQSKNLQPSQSFKPSQQKFDQSPQSCCQRSRQQDQNSQKYESSQRFDQGPQQYKLSSQQFDQSPQSCCQSSQHDQSLQRFEGSQTFGQSPQKLEPHPQIRDRNAQSPGRFDKSPHRVEDFQQYDPNSQHRSVRCPQKYHQSPPQYDQSPQRIDRSRRFNQNPQDFYQGSNQSEQCQRLRPAVGFDRQSRVTSKSQRSSAPPGYKTEGSTQPLGPTPETLHPCSNSGISGEPLGFSTPEQHGPIPSRPRKRNKVRRRLDMEETDDEIVEERCGCIEKFYGRRRKMNRPCDDEEYVPCFLRYPRPCYY